MTTIKPVYVHADLSPVYFSSETALPAFFLTRKQLQRQFPSLSGSPPTALIVFKAHVQPFWVVDSARLERYLIVCPLADQEALRLRHAEFIAARKAAEIAWKEKEAERKRREDEAQRIRQEAQAKWLAGEPRRAAARARYAAKKPERDAKAKERAAQKAAEKAAWRAAHLTRQEVLARHGWSPALIRSQLGKPDYSEFANRHGQERWYFLRKRVETAEASEAWNRVVARRNRPAPVGKSIDLLAAIWTVTRSAKRYRDAAQAAYQAKAHGFAGVHRRKKEHLYALKDRGIAQAYLDGRIVPEAMVGPLTVYRGEGYCYHSLLQPTSWEPQEEEIAEGDPLRVEAKPKTSGEPLLRDAMATLAALPLPDGNDFVEMSFPEREPTHQRARSWGHRSHDDDYDEDDYEDDF